MIAVCLGGLFDCFSDSRICLYGCCCTPCLFGENAEKIDGSSCFNAGCLWYLMSGWGLCCLTHMGKRKALRDRFNLPENCNDCVATTFCAPCAVCQEARELKARLTSTEGIGTCIDVDSICIFTIIRSCCGTTHVWKLQFLWTNIKDKSGKTLSDSINVI